MSKELQTVFYNYDDLTTCEIDSKEPYMITNDRMKVDGTIGRSFKIFKSFDEFLENRDKYKHCHELMLNHKVNEDEMMSGRLVFDFDIKEKYDKNNEDNFVPNSFKMDVEEIIMITISRYYKDVDIEIIKFVWTTSPNPEKFSKHLTIKNFYFKNWIEMTKIFYKLFSIVWNEYKDYIHS